MLSGQGRRVVGEDESGIQVRQVHLHHGRRGLLARQGHHRRLARHAAQGTRPQGRRAEARSVHERRSGNDVAVPARRGLRDRGRRRDRPRPRPLRALHRREHLACLELDGRQRLQHGHPPRAQRRVPRLDGPGDPAHHRRDQEPHPARLVVERRRHRPRRDRRHGGRHREPAVPRGHPPAAHAARPRQRALPARHARADDRGRRRAQDQAHAALRERAAPHRYLSRRRRGALLQSRSRTSCAPRSRSSPTSTSGP